MDERLFKVLNADGTACHGGTLQWSLPNGQPGAWHEVTGQLIPCERGLHICRERDLLKWLGPAIYLAEADGELLEAEGKVVVRRARLLARIEAWTERNARLFAVTCVRHALDRERAAGREPDARSWAALDAAVAFAQGQTTVQALAAAWDAAWAAARAAAGAAAGAAARAAAGAAAGAAAWAAARAAAGDAAGDAARAAAWAAAGDAAGDAARAAAWAAARAAAGDAARAAAWAAARAAAWDAAWDAERQWQTTELLRVLFPAERKA